MAARQTMLMLCTYVMHICNVSMSTPTAHDGYLPTEGGSILFATGMGLTHRGRMMRGRARS